MMTADGDRMQRHAHQNDFVIVPPQGPDSPPFTMLVAPSVSEHSEIIRWVDDAFRRATKSEGGRAQERADRSIEAGAGRGTVERAKIGGSPMVLRIARRGGFVRHFVRSLYLKPIGASDWRERSRPWSELRLLAELSAGGVSVPTPVAAAVRERCCGFAYQGALVTREIVGARALFQLGAERLATSGAEGPALDLESLSYSAGAEARKMLDAGVYHRDLHPGNVLIGESGRPVLIDFDGADRSHEISSSSKALRERLIARWDRAIEKYNLPSAISAGFASALR